MTNFEKYHEEMIEKKYKAVKNGKPISCKRVGLINPLLVSTQMFFQIFHS